MFGFPSDRAASWRVDSVRTGGFDIIDHAKGFLSLFSLLVSIIILLFVKIAKVVRHGQAARHRSVIS